MALRQLSRTLLHEARRTLFLSLAHLLVLIGFSCARTVPPHSSCATTALPPSSCAASAPPPSRCADTAPPPSSCARTQAKP